MKCTSALIGVVLTLSMPSAQQSGLPDAVPRNIDYARGANILAQLRPSDRVVQVIRRIIANPIPPPPGMTDVEWHTRSADAVIVVRVLEVAGELTPTSDWIESAVVVSVLQILKDTSSKLTDGQQLSFRDTSGGEIRTAAQVIRARTDSGLLFRRNQRYLVFGRFDTDGSFRHWPSMAWQVMGSRLMNMANAPEYRSRVDQSSIHDVSREVRSKAHLGRLN